MSFFLRSAFSPILLGIYILVFTGCSEPTPKKPQPEKLEETVETESVDKPASEDKPLETQTEPGIIIPLDQIWGHSIEGTRDIRELDLGKLPHGLRLLSTGSLNLIQLLDKDRASPGFVVEGTGQEAFVASHKKLPEGQVLATKFPFGKDLSIVYFSHAFAPYIALHSVERHGNVIDVRYCLNLTGAENASQHFALIPLGKLPVGEYRVNIIHQWVDALRGISGDSLAKLLDSAERSVSGSFSFSVEDAVDGKSG